MGKVRTVVVAVGCALLGAAAGRAVVQWRSQAAAGRPPRIDLETLQPRPREVIPGLVAALRVHDRPWSYLHIPSWLAAFAVNVAVGALAQEMAPVLRALGIDAPGEPQPTGSTARVNGTRAAGSVSTEVWTAEAIPLPPEPVPAPGFRPSTS